MPPLGFPGMMPPPNFPHMGLPPPPSQPLPDSTSSSSSGPSIAIPNPTLYVNNINEKIKIDELKKALFHVFSQFGSIIEISAFKDLRRRGQAWVVFETMASAAKALTEMANFSFYGKPLQVTYARVKSDVVSKKDNTFIARALRKAPKKRRAGKKSKKEKKEKKEGKREKKDRGDQPETDDGPNGEQDNGAPQQQPPAAPNRILFVENLPKQCTEQMLSMLFQPYSGYKEARLVNGKPGIAFVEFEDAVQSAIAKQALHNFKITPANNMKVTFARQ
jgi:RNA recognition motif-containing protein